MILLRRASSDALHLKWDQRAEGGKLCAWTFEPATKNGLDGVTEKGTEGTKLVIDGSEWML